MANLHRSIVLLLAALLLGGCATSQQKLERRKQEKYSAYSSLTAEQRTLVDQGQIATGLPMDAVYIAWGKPAQVLQQETGQGHATTWLYEGGWMEETRYWTPESRTSRMQYYYQPRAYVRAEIVFVNGQVESWRQLPQPVYEM